MAHPRANLRLFVAVYPPVELARDLVDALAPIELPTHRTVSSDQVHLTLQFIGDTPEARLASTIEAVQRAAAGLPSFELVPQRLITLPRRGRPRLVAAETDRPPTLFELQRRLATRLARQARRDPGDRFRPHLTLCRFRAPAAIPGIDEPLDLPSFPVRRIVLMRSTLAPDGARHHEVAACPLVA
ncbi:MAG: RNA 2',3'-cyclic phosphodiesterase [Planctomycetota bacterium]|jgi:2'-5' RNA ligase